MFPIADADYAHSAFYVNTRSKLRRTDGEFKLQGVALPRKSLHIRTGLFAPGMRAEELGMKLTQDIEALPFD